MSKGEMVRALFQQRLTAAAEEIFGLFERTIAEYEEELCRSKEENERQKQQLLDAVWKPEVRLQIKEEVPLKQQEWCPNQDQEEPPEPESPLIKEEQEELWSSPEGPEEADITKFPFSPVSVKSEDDEAKPQSAQLDRRHTEQMESAPLADGEDYGGPQLARNSHPDTHVQYESEEITQDCPENKDSQEITDSHFQLFQKNNEVSNSGSRSYNDPFSCSVCGKRFKRKAHVTRHMVVHTGERNFICSVCGKTFTQNSNLREHMAVHTGKRIFSCSVCHQIFARDEKFQRHKCVGPRSPQPHQNQTEQHREAELRASSSTEQVEPGADGEDCGEPQRARNPHPDKGFKQKDLLTQNMVICKGDKKFGCSVCSKRFRTKQHLTQHMVVHTGERNFVCSVCGKTFNRKTNLTEHMTIHSVEKRFSCCSCKKTFIRYSQLSRHTCDDSQSAQLHQQQHTEQMEPGADGEEDSGGPPQPARNSHPDARFTQEDLLTQSSVSRKGEKRFCCSVCSKRFRTKQHLTQHIVVHTGERNFKCSVCSKTFNRKTNLTEHMTLHTGEKRYSCCTCKKTFIRYSQLHRHTCDGSQSAQLHQQQHTEEMETGADGEDCGGPQQARNSHPDTHVQQETEESSGSKDSQGITEMDSEEEIGGSSETENSDDY